MKTEWLRALDVIATEQSLNKAALRLRLSQSALSRQIQALEREIGTELLDRASVGVRLSAAGAAFAKEASEMLMRLDRAASNARRTGRGEQPELRIGFLQSAAHSILTPALRELRRAHPELKISLRDMSPGEQIDALRRGELDAALVGPEGQVLAREFYTRNLGDIPVYAAVSEDGPLGARRELELADLANEVFVDFPETDLPGRRRWMTGLCRKAGFKPRFGPKAESIAHLLTLVVSEPAASLLPGYMRANPHPGVALIPLKQPAPVWPLLLVWRRGKAGPGLRHLIDSLAQESRCTKG